MSMAPHVAELEAEHRDLEALLRPLAPDQWFLPTPAKGWDVRDQVSHLADTEEIAYDTASGGARQLNEEARRFSGDPATMDVGAAYTQWMVDKGRDKVPGEVLEWWLEGSRRLRRLLVTKDPKERIPWGLGMSARAFVAARMMEHWAHGLDIRAAVGAPVIFEGRHRNVAWLITQAGPYAFTVAGIEPPPGALRVELDSGGETWAFGPPDADNRISGDALEFCRLGVQRLDRAGAQTLKADGALADAFLSHARAFL